MGLSDFERELATAEKSSGSRKRERSRSRDRRHRHSSSKHTGGSKSHPHHHSSRHHERDKDEERSSRKHKRSRLSHDDDDSESDEPRRKRKNDLKRTSSDEEDEGDGWVEKESYAVPPEEEDLDDMLEEAAGKDMKRQSWMQAPSAIDIDYVQRRKPEEKPSKSQAATVADYKLKVHKNELNSFLKDVQEDNKDDVEKSLEEPAEHEVNYEFGDAGSQWRMTKLRAVYTAAQESGKPVEELAVERFGGIREFDDAREEEQELERRKTYGKGYVGKIKPSGELFQERKLSKGIHRESPTIPERLQVPHGQVVQQPSGPVLDQTALNKLRAQMMKAKLRKDPKAASLEEEYNAAVTASVNRAEPNVVVLGAMENRMLAGRENEVIELTNKRGRERGLVVENEDMSIEDMVRQERRTKTQNGGMVFAESIAKDAKFDTDLDYQDDNAAKLAKSAPKSTVNLRNTAISDYQKMNRILDTCPLCHHEEKDEPPVAPIVSLGTRVYLTLPTEPEISSGGAVIVPIQHRTNLMECDDDEWEEIRNFMKSAIRMYHDQGRDVIFYENAARPGGRKHASMEVVPLPFEFGETAPAYFREAILAADEEWTQHKKVIDTGAKAREGLGRSAFRRTMVKEAPYFHVWFGLDGGLGHVVEDSNRWPKGDLFAREIVGGMLDVEATVVKKQGRWHRADRRVEGLRKKWRKFDWTRVLTEGQ